jgi:uncharacterized membrane protein YgcG
MIYYFAQKGYLSIDLENEDDPVLVKKVGNLDQSVPHHQKTLFNGLFLKGDRVAISDLKGTFYSVVDIAKRQVLGTPMYASKSIFGFVAGGIIGAIFGFFVPFFSGLFRVGGGFAYPFGFAFAFPIAVILFLIYTAECYRFKWKAKTIFAIKAVCLVLSVIFSLIFSLCVAGVLMTEAEKAVLCVVVFLATFLTQGALTRTEQYTRKLGDILGFKDFIVVTEEDKIKFMLEENPQLYYHILPYAQVLGVTNEWEKKFASITIEPPSWCENTDFTLFDYMLLNRVIHRSMLTAITPPKSQGNGSFAGRSGGGGFGGFGGGGHGGGGGGFR